MHKSKLSQTYLTVTLHVTKLNCISFQGDISTLLMLTVFGVVSLVAGFLVILLPETKDKHLPETTSEGEEFGKNFTVK